MTFRGPSWTQDSRERNMTKIAIIGGGPGGLITAYLLKQKLGDGCKVTLFEVSGRLGGKLDTRRFDCAPVPYEAGAAECYDYRGLGPDPLHDLVDELGLSTRPMTGQTVVLDGTPLRNMDDIRRCWGPSTVNAIERFRQRARAQLPLDRWHPGDWRLDNAHAWARPTCEELLDEVEDEVARRYLSVAAHSDLATEPHRSNGLNGLKNFVMDVPGYLGFYAIDGGMGQIARRLSEEIGQAHIRLGTRVARVEAGPGGTYRILAVHDGRPEIHDFDAVVVALPAIQLGSIDWRGAQLRRAMARHIGHFDRPGHYLRVSLLFERPFWRERLTGSWFMVDAFGGACVYDECARYDAGGYGVLGFLLAGSEALNLGNTDEKHLVRRVLESLPDDLGRDARRQLLEAKIHRWAGGVSAQPGGLPLLNPEASHQPDARAFPQLFIVGDYLFDSTLNGACRSADLATTLLAERIPAKAEWAIPVRC